MSGQNSMAWRVERLTEKRLTWLIDQASESVCKATLAELRRGVGREPGEIPALWGMLLEDMPEDMQGRGTRASRQEMAIYIALTLFAVHQQGWEPRKNAMYQPEIPLGKAVARLVVPGDEDSRERVERRFTRAATAADMAELAHHMRGLVQLFRAEGIPLDWARLAGQLYDYQDVNRVANIRLRWGEEFYAALNCGQSDNKQEEDKNEG